MMKQSAVADCRNYADLGLPTETGKRTGIFEETHFARTMSRRCAEHLNLKETGQKYLRSTAQLHRGIHCMFRILNQDLFNWDTYWHYTNQIGIHLKGFREDYMTWQYWLCNWWVQLLHGHNYVEDGSTLQNVPKTNLWEGLHALSPLNLPIFLKGDSIAAQSKPCHLCLCEHHMHIQKDRI